MGIARRPEQYPFAKAFCAAPRLPEIDRRKELFAGLNEFIRQRAGFMVSVPGDPDMRFEALPGSTLPEQLRGAGYTVTEIGRTERILPHAVEQKFVIGAGGTLELATARSTRPISQTTTHAGIVATTVYELRVSKVSPDQGRRIAP